MDERRNPLTDEALDRQLDRALSVDPSPEFAARVRMRIAGETMRPLWWSFRWHYVAGVSVVSAAIMLAIVIGGRPHQTGAGTTTATVQPHRGPAPVAAAPQSAPDIEASRQAAANATPGTNAPGAKAPGADTRDANTPDANTYVASGFSRTIPPTRDSHHLTTEVLVPPGQEQAIRMFAAAAWRQQPFTPAATVVAAEEPLEIAPIDISPIEIEPLPQMAALEGERP